MTRLTKANLKAIDHLVTESLSQGFGFVARLVREYSCDRNCFDKYGEILLAAFLKDRAIAICGLNQDPYSRNTTVGRLRHLYVESAYRRSGVGSLLVSQIITEAKQHYQILTLRTDNSEADKFYRTLGLEIDPPMPQSTHYLKLNDI